MGGTFLVQNKVRPGAYINFVAEADTSLTPGDRGIVTIPTPMTWGPEKEVITLYQSDLLNGKSLPKVGVVASDADSLIFRLALTHCPTGLFYRVDTGGVKAAVTVGKLISTAKYPGTTGNSLSIVVAANGANHDVITLFNSIEKDRQTVADATDLEDNDWIDFTYTTDGALTDTAGAPLVGGTNGTVTDANITTDYFNEMESWNWTTMGIPSADTDLPPLAKAYIDNLRDTQGVKVQCVVYDYPEADSVGIISSDQGYTTATETISAVNFVAQVASMTAGAAINSSNTGKVISNAVSIVNPYTNAEIEAGLEEGKFLLSQRRDGTVKVEQDRNTLVNMSVNQNYAFKKNRVIRCLDDIGNQTSNIWDTTYSGKVNNDATGRLAFKSDLINYANTLQSISAIQNFDSQIDIEVEAGDDIDAVVASWFVQPVDSMEKLYMTVTVTNG